MNEHEKRLKKTCAEAMGTASMSSVAAIWMGQIFQLGHSEVIDKDFAAWLLTLADYCREKDKPYADYLTGLAGTYRGPK